MKNRVILWILVTLVFLGILIQLIPLPSRGVNPPVISEPPWDSPQTRLLVQRACFDCHSNETVWPWYSYVAPVSWLVCSDTMRGRSRMNFSDWSNRHPEIGEIIEVIQEGEMPPSIYLPMHPNAQLTAPQKQQLITGLSNTLK